MFIKILHPDFKLARVRYYKPIILYSLIYETCSFQTLLVFSYMPFKLHIFFSTFPNEACNGGKERQRTHKQQSNEKN